MTRATPPPASARPRQLVRVGKEQHHGPLKTRVGNRSRPLLGVLREAVEILGHSRISVTMEIYTHGDGESRENALKRVTGLFE